MKRQPWDYRRPIADAKYGALTPDEFTDVESRWHEHLRIARGEVGLIPPPKEPPTQEQARDRHNRNKEPLRRARRLADQRTRNEVGVELWAKYRDALASPGRRARRGNVNKSLRRHPSRSARD